MTNQSPLPPLRYNSDRKIYLLQDVMDGDQRMSFNVAVELKNEKGVVIGKQTVSLDYGYFIPNKEGRYNIRSSASSATDRNYRMESSTPGRFTVVRPYDSVYKTTVTVKDVKAGEITEKLSITITSIDGIKAETTAQTKHISILTREERDKLGYKVGLPGPAGGFVFYDKGSYSEGWRYLEAAQSDWAGLRGTNGLETKWSDATKYCRELVVDGLTGWRLPNRDELNLMYTNLARRGLGSFDLSYNRELYWSSVEGTEKEYDRTIKIAWTQNFKTGRQESRAVNYSACARAVRAF
jgi:hypothetical protein